MLQYYGNNMKLILDYLKTNLTIFEILKLHTLFDFVKSQS